MTEKRDSKRKEDLVDFIEAEDSVENDDGAAVSVDDTFYRDFFDPHELSESDDTAPISPQIDEDEIDNFENSWLGDASTENENPEVDLGEGMDDLQEKGEIEHGSCETPSIEDAWFIDDASDGTPDDGGAEGPAEKETFDIDETAWDALDEDESESSEDVYTAMQRMDISLPDFDEDPEEADVLPAANGLTVFLGPKHGRVEDAMFVQGRPMGVGDHLFIQGADGQFHATIETQSLDLDAVDLTAFNNAIFIGTQRRGALSTTDTGRTIKSLNSWYTAGFLRGADVTIDECSTAFSLKGHVHSRGFRLLGRTGEGQIFASDDMGASWYGPLLKGSCIELFAPDGGDTVWAVTRDSKNSVSLFAGDDLRNWEKMYIPERLACLLTPANVGIAPRSAVPTLFAKNAACPPFVTLDRGRTWTSIHGFSKIAAFVSDGQPHGFVAAAQSAPHGEIHIIVSFNGGSVRYLALTLAPTKENTPVHVHSLTLSGTSSKQLLVVTDVGVYLLTFQSEALKH